MKYSREGQKNLLATTISHGKIASQECRSEALLLIGVVVDVDYEWQFCLDFDFHDTVFFVHLSFVNQSHILELKM